MVDGESPDSNQGRESTWGHRAHQGLQGHLAQGPSPNQCHVYTQACTILMDDFLPEPPGTFQNLQILIRERMQCLVITLTAILQRAGSELLSSGWPHGQA